MSVTEEQAPADPEYADPPAPKPKQADPEPVVSGPSTRNVLLAGGTLAATLAGVLLFAAGGWILLLGGAAVAGTAGIATARARRTTRTSSRPGLLHTLLTRPRRTRSTKTWTKTWPLTGNQSKRARSKGAGLGTGSSKGRGRTGGPKLPALTGKGRAKRAATSASGRLGKHTPGPRPVPRTPRAAAAARRTRGGNGGGPGKGRLSTPTRTGAKATRGPLVKPSAKKAAAARPTRPATGTTPRTRLATAKKSAARPGTGRGSSKARGVLPKVSNGGKGATVLPFKRPTKRHTGTSGKRPATPSRPGTKPSAPRSPRTPRVKAGTGTRRTPGTRTGLLRRRPGTRPASKLGKRRTTGAGTRSARRMATPKVRRNRIDRTPNRTKNRPRPYRRPTNRSLLRAAFRLPRRNGWKITRPTKRQGASARSKLRKRAFVAGRRGARWAAVAPFRAARWGWVHKPRLVPMVPGPVNPDWLIPNTPDVLQRRVERQRRSAGKRHRNPYPQVARRRASGVNPSPEGATVMTTTPLEQIDEAWAQLANFDPDNATEIRQFMSNLGHTFTEGAAQLGQLAQRWGDEQPLAAEVLQAVQQLASALAGAADVADEAHSQFLVSHEVELQRLDNPRAGEAAWDVTRNQ